MEIYFHEFYQGRLHPKFETTFFELLPNSLRNKCSLKPLPDNLLKALTEFQVTNDLTTIILESLGYQSEKYRVFLSTLPTDPIAAWFRNQAPHAEWGGSTGFISIEYSPIEKCLATQLHEVFHLLDVDDCYNPQTRSPKSTCNNPSCLMRYEPRQIAICDNVVMQLSHFQI